MIKTADWIIDLGPEGGDGGGRIIATGSPDDIARNRESYTGQYFEKCVAGGCVNREIGLAWLLRNTPQAKIAAVKSPARQGD